MYPDNVRFVDTHEWVKIDSGSVVFVGITHHAQELLGDLVYVELPKVGIKIKSHEVIGVVESVKAASDLYAPVTGEVVALNNEVISDPTLANTDPHNKGWLLKVKLDDVAQLDSLMSASEYKTLIGIS